MVRYNDQLDGLFAKWQKEYGSGRKNFCCDGIMFKGTIREENSYWGRNRGTENQEWHNAKMRVLFLMKDPNRNPGEDMREWIGRQGEEVVTGRFFSHIALWLYGLSRVDRLGNFPPFSQVNDPKAYTDAFDTLPLAIVNIKKRSGGDTVSNDTLATYLNRGNNALYLKKEIAILQPNVVVCGGGSGLVMRVAREIIFPEISFTEVDHDVCFSTKPRLVLLNSYHPSWWAVSSKEMYERVMKGYKRFRLASTSRR